MEILTHSTEETKRIAADFARTLQGGELVLLEGELGAGKTTFAQGLCEALGVQGPVRSPTFAVMNLYPAAHSIIKQVVHLDFYRFKKPEEARELGLEEWLNRLDTLVLAEWPQLAGPYLGAKTIRRVRMSARGEEERCIEIS